ncbi:hypothetical protein J3R83DRAFT_11388 [Lanmaoa asiatica]|nr:hypothetical protein J3R83DRAFT_11388 [Lanmaoa asiatica]
MGQPTIPGAKPKKGVFKLASLAKRNRSRKDLSDTASASGSVSRSTSVSEHGDAPGKARGDEGISLPWNFQHNIHVDEGYIGLPPSWSAALSQAGFDEDEIAAIHARRRAAATSITTNTKLADTHTTERSASPHASTVTPPAIPTSTLLHPLPRSTSLGKRRDVPRIHPPSMYSVGGGPPSMTGGASPAPSPRAPSFSMKSFVSGIKDSLTSDSASTKEGATGEESEQYVFVNGDDPDESGDQGMGDETFIEPYPFDTSSVSSHQTHSSRGQQTPRTPTFPQIHVQRTRSDAGHIPFPSSTSRAPSPLAHSTSLPIPTPPRGYSSSNHSSSPSPSHSPAGAGLRPGPASAPPRTPPRRIYHIANASSDSYEGENYTEPPPAYVSPKGEKWATMREKEGGPPPPNRPIPPVPTKGILGEPSGVSNHDSREEDQEVSMDITADDIPRTADEVLDISSYYTDITVHGADAEVDPTQQARVLSPIPPLEGSLEDWSESLFSVIGGKGKRSSVLMGSRGRDATNVKKERRLTIRPMSPLSMTSGSRITSAVASDALSPEPAAPSLSDVSFGANLALGPHARGVIGAVEEGDEQEQTEETESGPEEDAGEQVDADDNGKGGERSGCDADPEPPGSTTPPPPESLHRASIDSLPPSPPPKPKPKLTPLALPPAVTLAPPRTRVITGVSGKSPVNPLFGAKPQPLPIPIPPSQIRAQLRPAPPKPLHPPPTLPLPPIKRTPSQPDFQLPSPHRSQFTPVPSPQLALKHDSTATHASSSNSRPNSSQTLLPIRASPGDRNSDLSTITVTPATIATAKTEVVRTAIASVIDSDAVSLAPRRESVVSTADTESQTLTYDEPDIGRESPRTQEHGEAPDDSMVSETSSVSLLRDGSQSKWPAPPPPPVELETDSTPRRVSRFRTTSLGRVTQLQAMGTTTASPISFHSSHGSSETISSSTSESVPLTTPKGVDGVSPSAAPKTNGSLASETRFLTSTTDTFGGVDVESESESGEENEGRSYPSETPLSESRASTTHPLLAQLQPYITPRDPASCFTDLVEIAEGESGSVFAARVAPSFADARSHEEEGTERPITPGTSHVAIKRIPLPPLASSPSLVDDSPVSNKLVSVLHELCVLRDLDHEHLLLLDAVYVRSNSTRDAESTSAVDTSLWIRMELMERSLADVIGLVAEGLALQERLVGRFASDILHGLDYLQRQHIAHRDVRSDNLLVNATGIVKLADFSNAIRVDRNAPTVNGAVGVIYWQAPEMRAGPYNALKVDIWSLGATIWELAETVPPFSMPASPSTQVSFAIQTARHLGSQWPPLTHPEHYSRAFHEFLRLCGRESAGRPGPGELLNTPFIRNACGRTVILQLLSQCRAIEEAIAAKEAFTSQS